MVDGARHMELQGTDKTPAVSFDPAAGVLSLTGCSIPENADRFFTPLYDVVERYATDPAQRTTVRVTLTYFNSSSAKYLLDIFKRLEDLHASGRSRVQLEWRHAPGDLDMAEAGQDYRSLLEFPVKLVEYED
ncbi:MAG: DUF1987 domain-containing protein [Flavobacteriales bacterium]|jgi:hypothetical protein|nr:DUF1987 domain-containing protein [Flavobacteriales bacterium]MBP7409114.1 DUF1987 domain-containing protein [Flavobacteriales bacterium]